MRKPAFLHMRKTKTQISFLCFRYIDSTIPLLPIYEISCFKPSCVVVQPGFLWGLVGNLKDWFSHNEAHLVFEPATYDQGRQLRLRGVIQQGIFVFTFKFTRAVRLTR